MNDLWLEDRAENFRALLERHDYGNTETRERLLPALCDKAEDLAAALLAAGSTEPSLKVEIIAWVVRFRGEMQRYKAAETVTRTFDYDTTDPRTQHDRRPAKKNRFLRSDFGSSRRAISFSQELLALREDVEKARNTPDTDLASLLNRIVKLYQARKTELKSNYEHEVGDELDGMAIRVAGITAREAAAAARSKTRFHKPVPDEVAPIFSEQVVSGGLPTLGRGRR